MADHIEQYGEYRAEGKELNSKLMKSLNDDELLESAQFLDMTDEEDGKEVVYHESELDTTAQSDFLCRRETRRSSAVPAENSAGARQISPC